jgi:phenylalanyl-tRNA synthetase alpha chain
VSADSNSEKASIESLEGRLQVALQQAKEQMKSTTDSRSLLDVKVAVLGKQGSFSVLMREMAQLSPDGKKAFGQMINVAKASIEAFFEALLAEFKAKELASRLDAEALDVTLPGPRRVMGSEHPIALVIDEIATVLARLGYALRAGPLVERDLYNFESLNIPKDHPARDMQDTFYIDDQYVLRTHTSPIQCRALLTEKPPFRICGAGAVFRCDSDISHSPHFHQIEGFCVDRSVSMSDLKGTIGYFVREFFGRDLKTRFRPSFFPFTEPSAEVDCECPICEGKGCRMCSHTGWVEIGGCGLTHPNVLKSAGLSTSDWQAFAFGFGIERMAIIKYGIDDIRLFAENDVRFLNQFAR